MGTLSLTDVEIVTEDIPGWLVASEGGLTVALDVNLTDELRGEGIARDFVNRIQNLRKDRDFQVTDKIRIQLERTTTKFWPVPSTPTGRTSARKYRPYHSIWLADLNGRSTKSRWMSFNCASWSSEPSLIIFLTKATFESRWLFCLQITIFVNY